MRMKRLGRTNLMCSENSFGALPVQRLSLDDAAKLLQSAYEKGINFFDTALSYSDSEEKIGAALSGVREKIIIATKTPSKTRTQTLLDLDTSLSRMKTDYVDIFQLHNITELPDVNDKESAHFGLLEARSAGKCRFIGITTHRLDVALEAARCGLYDTVQFPLSYLATDDELKLIDVCKQHDVGLIAMKGMSGGLITSGKAAYAFFAQLDSVVPIWGMQKQCELDEFIACAEQGITLTPELEQIIAEDKKTLVGNFCRGCGYCQSSCPAKINISWVARMKLMLRRAPWQTLVTEHWQSEVKKVEQCINCGACKKRCPYQLDCPELLRENLEDYIAFCQEKGVM